MSIQKPCHKALRFYQVRALGLIIALIRARYLLFFGFDNPEPYAQDICRLADDLDALHARQLACFERAKDPVFHKSTAKTAWDELPAQKTAR